MVCTVEQKTALASMMHSGVRLGAVRPEFANRMLMPNGVLSDEVDAMMSVVLSLADPVKVNEVNAMLGERRFLFVLDDDGVPHTYFQCAVPGNPDVERDESPESLREMAEAVGLVVASERQPADMATAEAPLVVEGGSQVTPRLSVFKRLWRWFLVSVCRRKGR